MSNKELASMANQEQQINVIKLVEELTKIAGALDAADVSDLADRVDRATSVALDIKTAQYVGIQGYWIRNARCWGNCYRQKRTASPTQPTQEIWAECHKEYLDSVNKPGTKWDKYAEQEVGLIKSSIAKHSFDNDLVSKLASNIKQGIDIETSVIASMEEQKSSYVNSMLDASNELLRIADAIQPKDLTLAIRLAHAASEFTKESQSRWWHPADWIGGIGDWADQNRAGHADNLRNKADNFVNPYRAKADNYLAQEKRRNNPYLNSPSAPGSPSVPTPGSVPPPSAIAKGSPAPAAPSPAGGLSGIPGGSSAVGGATPKSPPGPATAPSAGGPPPGTGEDAELSQMDQGQLTQHYMDLSKQVAELNGKIAKVHQRMLQLNKGGPQGPGGKPGNVPPGPSMTNPPPPQSSAASNIPPVAVPAAQVAQPGMSFGNGKDRTNINNQPYPPPDNYSPAAPSSFARPKQHWATPYGQFRPARSKTLSNLRKKEGKNLG